MQIQTFLDRIHFTGDPGPSYEALERLIRCHLEAVPFENLDCYNDPKELSLRPEDLFDKVVNRRRGGVCFELNGLMYWALGELGYERYPVSVRISMFGEPAAPITHQGNVVILDGEKIYCDVGFGGPGPKGILRLDTPEIQIVDGEAFRVEKDGIHYRIFRMDKGNWLRILAFADIPSDTRDFDFLLFYFTANPNSGFVKQRMVNLSTPTGSLALTGNTFTKRENGTVIRRELGDEREVAEVLKTEYGLVK